MSFLLVSVRLSEYLSERSAAAQARRVARAAAFCPAPARRRRSARARRDVASGRRRNARRLGCPPAAGSRCRGGVRRSGAEWSGASSASSTSSSSSSFPGRTDRRRMSCALRSSNSQQSRGCVADDVTSPASARQPRRSPGSPQRRAPAHVGLAHRRHRGTAAERDDGPGRGARDRARKLRVIRLRAGRGMREARRAVVARLACRRLQAESRSGSGRRLDLAVASQRAVSSETRRLEPEELHLLGYRSGRGRADLAHPASRSRSASGRPTRSQLERARSTRSV